MGLMGWLIAAGAVTLLAVLPLGVSAVYDSNGPVVRIIAGPLKLQVFPGNGKPKKDKKKPKAAKSTNKTDQKPAQKKSGGPVTDFLPLVKVGLDFLGDFRRKLRVNRLEMNLILAGDDPCDLATNYGRAWTALGNLWPQLERCFVIKKRNVQIQCDFENDQTLVTARLDLTITLGRLLALVVRYGIRAVKEFLNIQKKRKGGATI
ncbi:MAG: DUF2953 domain-containing protein [Oscillospiraceae bacterium]|nr:DUF2953 domain-containing protein [Oscillospiraceae bacterium]